MYVSILMLAVTVGGDASTAQCSSRAGCSAPAMVRRATCSAPAASCSGVTVYRAAPSCTSTTAVSGCSGRVGLLQRHHQRVAARSDARAQRHDVATVNIGLRRGTMVLVAPATNQQLQATPKK